MTVCLTSPMKCPLKKPQTLKTSVSYLPQNTLVKGLEWDYVFVIGMEQGTFPSQMALQEGNLEDERNLAYVTVTRAPQNARHLWSHVPSRFFEGKLEPSQFMREAYLNVTYENY